jgi:CheY-like chemotaxis protein
MSFGDDGMATKHAVSSERENVEKIRRRKLAVLVVDDDPSLRKAMSVALHRKYGAEVGTAESASEATQRLKADDPYDLIFLDIMMPGLSGVDAYPEILTLSGGATIVMMSAYPDSEEWSRAKELDVELVSKPIPEKVLEQLLLQQVEDFDG